MFVVGVTRDGKIQFHVTGSLYHLPVLTWEHTAFLRAAERQLRLAGSWGQGKSRRRSPWSQVEEVTPALMNVESEAPRVPTVKGKQASRRTVPRLVG